MAYKSQPTVTWSATAAAYAANDVVGGVIQFGEFLSGVDILVTCADIMVPIAAIPAGMTSFFIPLYKSTPVSAFADNDAWSLTAADRSIFLGIIELGSPVDRIDSLFCEVTQISKQIRALTGVYGYLVTSAAFTPPSNSVASIVRLHGVNV